MSADMAAVVTGDRPIVVEQPRYASLPGTARVAVSDVFGRTAPSATWSFPGGDSRSRAELLALFNPSPQTAELEVTFYGSDGRTITRRVSLPPANQALVDVGALGADLTGLHGMVVHATNGVGVVAEQTSVAPNVATFDSSEGCAF
jgi:hypothetical protein